MAGLDVKIEVWKKRLLDLGKRNRLINYKETKRSNIKIIEPGLIELYQKLVLEEKELEFPYITEDNYDEELEDENFYHAGEVSSGDLKTDRTIKEQQKTLASLRSKAKTAMEEQGVNILYLAFGFLRWKESLDSDVFIKSPIVLVPVRLILETITSPFILKLHEDEIVINSTLSHKLENDFGISLPELNGNEEDIVEYLNKVKRVVSTSKWEVIHETSISLFSFSKINMYKDLERNSDKIKSHPILKGLSGDREGLTNIPEEYNDYDHDNKTRPIDTFHVLNSDSSQQDAILYLKKGASFVLQGPPGTGKSQTITNMIAECLSDGKKVLFVSEKMAALEVVHKRISQVGLDDFCLMLHSQKAKKKEILDQLGHTLQLNKIKVQEETLYKLRTLEDLRNNLNTYSKELHTKCLPLNKSFYEANGALARLYKAPDVIFNLENVAETTLEKLNSYKSVLHNLSNSIGKMKEDYNENPWRNSVVSNVTHELRHDIETKLRRLIPKVKLLIEDYSSINRDLELSLDHTFGNLVDTIEVLKVASTSPVVLWSGYLVVI